jgi:tRNA threonylcarbamoyladenosine biosynthesis protein TsaB
MATRRPGCEPYAGGVLLAFDTSSDVVTVALHDGSRVVAHRMGSGVRRHAEVLTPLVSQVLDGGGIAGTDLDGIAVGVGPGAYTGLRVGLVTAQALSVAWSVPHSGACSLDAMAVQALGEHPGRFPDGLLVVTDARRRQVFWARYTPEGRRVGGPGVGLVESVASRELPAVGSGALAHRDHFAEALEPAVPDAGWLAQGLLDGRVSVQPVVPVYLRQPDVTVAAGAKPVLQPGVPRRG